MLASALGARLIRLQCYEGLDVSPGRLRVELLAASCCTSGCWRASGNVDRTAAERELFSEEFLIKRPLLQALDPGEGPVVLLIDELDRADEEFEG